VRSVTGFYLVCKGGGSGTKYVKLKRHHPRVHVKDYKKYIPPGSRSPEKNDGGGLPISPNFIAVQQNEGGWGV